MSSCRRKRFLLPVLTRNTLWYVIIFGAAAMIGILASLIVPLVMRHRRAPVDATHALIAAIADAVDAYSLEYGQCPSSTNQELVKELTGQNAMELRFIVLHRGQLNRYGEVVDAWDTPLRFISSRHGPVQIISAGPDRTFGTSDDVMNSSSPPDAM